MDQEMCGGCRRNSEEAELWQREDRRDPNGWKWDLDSREKLVREGGKENDLSSCILCGHSCILQLFIRNSVYAIGSFGVSEADTVLIDKDILSAAHLLWDAKEEAPCSSAIG